MRETGRNAGAAPTGAVAVVVAAGRSERFGNPKKQFAEVCGLPVVAHTLRALEASPLVEGMVLVVPGEDLEKCEREVIPRAGCSRVLCVVAGGADRQESVYRGLARVPNDAEWVLVHDGVRPLVSPELVERVLEGARSTGAAVPGLPLSETIKQSSDDRLVARTVDRRGIWRIQTPQAFRRTLLLAAHERAAEVNLRATDDAALVEAVGVGVVLVDGEEQNIKITTHGDFRLVESVLARRREGARVMGESRVGIGYDVHRLVPGDGLVLGGVTIPCEFSLQGHSDADVLCHAVMDAILGALGEKDIGFHFPTTDPGYEGARSTKLLERVVGIAAARGFRVVNADAVVVAEKPMLGGHVAQIKRSLASAIRTSADDVGVKATTSEGMGFVGRGEGICAWAAVMLQRTGGVAGCL
ncbi:MAG: 2-C-methyl-D-erythritol 4-phosphate cytidylyltransferase [Firmicutes bacterium]|jgi:2-C-methyl-D-erythritol 4-phosphate cytidylyltransferase/2-C-methyl-D-erythritol 2,4-cyclodiphosphate synthase|nr:2-C-methyl-D-erythritol 4-phosphate cytidylyltransferase [Bacillota bacterium]